MKDAKILITDDDKDIRTLTRMVIEAEFDNEIREATSSKEAIEILKEDKGIGLVISDYNMPGGNGGNTYTFLEENNYKIPFILASTDHPFKHNEFGGFFSSDRFRAFVEKKKAHYKNLVPVISKALKQTPLSKKSKYNKVDIDRFFRFNKTNIDIFIKLSENKYIKVINAKEVSKIELIDKYRKRGVQFLYILKEDYVPFIEGIISDLEMKFKEIPLESDEMLQLQFDSTENIHESLRLLGINDQIISLTHQTVEKTVETAKKSKKLSKMLVKFMLHKNYIYQLSMLTNYIAQAIALKIDWNERKLLEKLSFAALLMDVSLEDEEMAKITRCDEESYISVDHNKQSQIIGHPNKSVEMIDKLDQITNDTKKIIQLHHRRPNGQGYPQGEASIFPPACILILAHEFSHRLLTLSFNKANIEKTFNDFQESYSDGAFKKPYQALLTVFNRDKSE